MSSSKRSRVVKTYLSDREINTSIRLSIENVTRVDLGPRAGLSTYIREVALQIAQKRRDGRA